MQKRKAQKANKQQLKELKELREEERGRSTETINTPRWTCAVL
jgi:hypothetical protein